MENLHPVFKNIIREHFPNVEQEPDIQEPQTDQCFFCETKFIYGEESKTEIHNNQVRVYCGARCKKKQHVIDEQKRMGIIKSIDDECGFKWDGRGGFEDYRNPEFRDYSVGSEDLQDLM